MRNSFLYKRGKWRGSYQRNRWEDDFAMMCAGWKRSNCGRFRAIVPFAGVKNKLSDIAIAILPYCKYRIFSNIIHTLFTVSEG